MGFALHYNNRYHSIYCSYARHQSSAFYSFACHPSSHPIPWHQTCQGVQELYTAAIRSDLRQHEMIWTFSNFAQCTLPEEGKVEVHWVVNWLRSYDEKNVTTISKEGVPPLMGVPQYGDKGNETMVFVSKHRPCTWRVPSNSDPTLTLVPTQTLL